MVSSGKVCGEDGLSFAGERKKWSVHGVRLSCAFRFESECAVQREVEIGVSWRSCK